MAATPPHIQAVLDQLREVLLRWDEDDTLGEVTCVRGYHQYEVEERPRRKPFKAIKREQAGRKPIVRVG